MTINDLYLSYNETAKMLYNRVKELRAKAKEEPDPVKAKSLERRANSVMCMYKDVKKVASYLNHYYRKWGYKD